MRIGSPGSRRIKRKTIKLTMRTTSTACINRRMMYVVINRPPSLPSLTGLLRSIREFESSSIGKLFLVNTAFVGLLLPRDSVFFPYLLSQAFSGVKTVEDDHSV